MKWRTAATSLAIIFSCVTLPAQEAPGIRWHKSWREAVEAAKTSGKCVWAYVWREKCPYCDMMRDKTLPEEKVIERLGGFECANVAVHEDADFAEKYGGVTEGYPSYLFLNARGEVVHAAVGYMDVEPFLAELEWGQKALDLQKALDKAPDDPKAVFELGHLQAGRAMYGAPGGPQRALPPLRKLLELDPDDRLGYKEDALLDLNICRLIEGEADEALAGLQEHEKAYPQTERQPDRLYFLGAAHMMQKDYAEAKRFWELLIEQYPDTVFGRVARDRVESLAYITRTGRGPQD